MSRSAGLKQPSCCRMESQTLGRRNAAHGAEHQARPGPGHRLPRFTEPCCRRPAVGTSNREAIMLVDLVQTTTRDGVRLDGAFQIPVEGSTPVLAVDSFCLLHGTGSNF